MTANLFVPGEIVPVPESQDQESAGLRGSIEKRQESADTKSSIHMCDEALFARIAREFASHSSFESHCELNG